MQSQFFKNIQTVDSTKKCLKAFFYYQRQETNKFKNKGIDLMEWLL